MRHFKNFPRILNLEGGNQLTRKALFRNRMGRIHRRQMNGLWFVRSKSLDRPGEGQHGGQTNARLMTAGGAD